MVGNEGLIAFDTVRGFQHLASVRYFIVDCKDAGEIGKFEDLPFGGRAGENSF